MNYIVLKNMNAKFNFQEIQNDLACLGKISLNHIIQCESTVVDVVITLNVLTTSLWSILFQDGCLEFLSKSGNFYTIEIFYKNEAQHSTFSYSSPCITSTLIT
jgi:hypothetical protein